MCDVVTEVSEPCVFCEIVAKRAPAKIVAEMADTIFIEPLNPVTPGHVLAIPKQHVADARSSTAVTGMTFEDTADYLRIRRAVGVASREQWDDPIDAFNLITSRGTAATQSVFHLHVHIVPRREGDGLVLPWTAQQAKPFDYMSEFLEEGSALLDAQDRVWTVVRDGGMVTRPKADSESNVESGGIAWLQRVHGPLTVLHRAKPGEFRV